MTDLDDIDATAAEYVLGSLDAAERQAVAARRLAEPKLDAAIQAWERRLAPLIEAVPSVAPTPELFDRIRRSITGATSTNVLNLTTREQSLARRERGWRAAALTLGAFAASLVGIIAWRETVRPQGATYVAMLETGKTTPAMLLTVDTAKQTFAVRALTKPQERDKSYELWLVHDRLPAPRSLGLVAEDELKERRIDSVDLSGVDRSMFMNATFAVSVEPAGGSPTGAPTGPVVFTGKLYRTTP